MKKLIYLLFALLPLCSLANTASKVDSLFYAEPKVWVYNPEGQLIAKGLLVEVKEESVSILLKSAWQKRLKRNEAKYEMSISQIGYIKVLDNPKRKKLLARNLAINSYLGYGGGGLAGLAYALHGSHSLWIFSVFVYPPVFASLIGSAVVVAGIMYITYRIRKGNMAKYDASAINPQILD
ncbi:MAG: hypothetical protein AAF927_32090 [Bacteroidota bacterium]